jgi:predicted branched-subunit amino acid permease
MTPEWRSSFTTGLRAGAGPAAATFLLAMTYGAAAIGKGWGTTVPLLFSMIAWSSSAQFTLLTAGSAIPGIVAASLINVRYTVMSVALSDSLRAGRTGGARLRGALQVQALADASFAIAHRGHGEYDIPKLIGASCPQWLCWVLGTAVGLILAPSSTFIHKYGLDTALPAFFLVLAFEQMRVSGRAAAAGALGAAITSVLILVVPPGIALLAAAAAAGIGLLGRPAAAPGATQAQRSASPAGAATPHANAPHAKETADEDLAFRRGSHDREHPAQGERAAGDRRQAAAPAADPGQRADRPRPARRPADH